jgi:Uma2 family endonuclease
MPAPLTSLPPDWTLAEILEHLGGIDPRRVRAVPFPGTATEQDVIDLGERHNRLYELVDGILVEKVMGFYESALALRLGRYLDVHVDLNGLGVVTGPDGSVRLAPNLIRIPDLSYFSWDQFPGRRISRRKKIPDLAPLLAVEVLSEGNTPGEMRRKLKDYFLSGVRVVWFIDPESKTARVFTAPDESRTLREKDALEGGEVLPGFTLPLRELFARLPEDEEPAPPRKKRKRK